MHQEFNYMLNLDYISSIYTTQPLSLVLSDLASFRMALGHYLNGGSFDETIGLINVDEVYREQLKTPTSLLYRMTTQLLMGILERLNIDYSTLLGPLIIENVFHDANYSTMAISIIKEIDEVTNGLSAR